MSLLLHPILIHVCSQRQKYHLQHDDDQNNVENPVEDQLKRDSYFSVDQYQLHSHLFLKIVNEIGFKKWFPI